MGAVHLLFETLAYATGFLVYSRLRRSRGDFLDDSTRWTMIVAVVLGAAVGSKLLHHASHPAELAKRWGELAFLFGGKTIVGALLGGLVAVEGTKRWLGVRRATGDLYALPLVVGIAIGRVGCFLNGLADRTAGTPTSLPWGVDFGDGVARHPTQLYEIGFLAVLGIALLRGARLGPREGGSFRLFLVAYLAFRFAVDGLKPYERFAGLGGIQWASLFGLVYYAGSLLRHRAAISPSSMKEASSDG